MVPRPPLNVTFIRTLPFFIHSFIPLACAEFDDSLPFSGASSIPLCYVLFPATLPHQLFFHPLSPLFAIYFLVYLSVLLFQNSYIILFSPQCHHMSSQTSWSPPRLWLKCNRLLRVGRPVGAVTLSRWEWLWDERWIWGARGGGLKPNFYQLPRPWSPWASSPFKEKRTW